MATKYPFKFLDSYTREDKDIFFGRTNEIETLYQMCFQSNIMLVYGTSGTGKTSLIQCGLANKFQYYDWSSLFIRRGDNLVYALDKILWEETEGAFPEPVKKDNSIQNLTAKIESIYEVSLKPIYLIFDQFEELYILGDASEQDGFFKIVREILTIKRPVKIIISIREEYLGYLYEFEKEVPELLGKKLRVEPMNPRKVTSVIKSICTSDTGNVSLEKGYEDTIAQSIFEKIKGDEKTFIQLPYLQVFLDNLYQNIREEYQKQNIPIVPPNKIVFTRESVEKIKTFGDVLRDFLDKQVEKTSKALDSNPDKIWKILSPFVTLEGTKRPMSYEELLKEFKKEPTEFIDKIDEVIHALENSRILRKSEKDQRYEITHDSLAKQVNANRSPEEIAILEVKKMIKNLVEAQKGKNRVFDEEQLAVIKQFRGRIQLDTAEEKAIETSQHEVDNDKIIEEEKKKKELARTKNWMLTFGLLFIFAALFGVYAFWQKGKANVANELAQIEKMTAETERRNARKAEFNAIREGNNARKNLKQIYLSEINRYNDNIITIRKNIQFFKQYGAKENDDVIILELQKISRLETIIDSLKLNIATLNQ